MGIGAGDNSPSNPWRHLLELANPCDFVVAKIDVDSPTIEDGLIRQLMESEAIRSRVDVLLQVGDPLV